MHQPLPIIHSFSPCLSVSSWFLQEEVILVWAAITICRVNSLSNKQVSLAVLEAGKPNMTSQVAKCCFMVLPWPPSFCVLTWQTAKGRILCLFCIYQTFKNCIYLRNRKRPTDKIPLLWWFIPQNACTGQRATAGSQEFKSGLLRKWQVAIPAAS